MALLARFLMVRLVRIGPPTRPSVPLCRRARGRQGRRAPLKRWPEDGPSLTAAARDGTHCAQVGAEGWCRSNKRMGLPDTTSRTVYKIREAEAPILSATIAVMKKISFRSILLRPSYCARPIWSPDFKPLCYPLEPTDFLGNFDNGNKTKTIANLDQKIRRIPSKTVLRLKLRASSPLRWLRRIRLRGLPSSLSSLLRCLRLRWLPSAILWGLRLRRLSS